MNLLKLWRIGELQIVNVQSVGLHPWLNTVSLGFSVILIKLLIVAIEIEKNMLILFEFDARLGSQPLYNFCIFTYITYICVYNWYSVITLATTRTTRLKVNFQNEQHNCTNNQAKLLFILRAKFFKVSSILDKTFRLLHALAWFPPTIS